MKKNRKKNLELKKKRLKMIFSKVLKININKISDNYSQKDNENWDSYAHINLILEIEKEFKIIFSFKKLSNLNNFKSFLNLINE